MKIFDGLSILHDSIFDFEVLGISVSNIIEVSMKLNKIILSVCTCDI